MNLFYVHIRNKIRCLKVFNKLRDGFILKIVDTNIENVLDEKVFHIKVSLFGRCCSYS